MAPKINVQYFDIRGRAEPIRLALLLGDVPFNDERVAFNDWPALKPTTPFGSLPVVTVGGEAFGQSLAALRYAGKLTGLYPEDAKAALRVDVVIDTLADLMKALFAGSGEPAKKVKEIREKAVVEAVPRYFGALEKIISGWSDGPFVTGPKVSIADLLLTELFVMVKEGKLDHIPKDCLDKQERLYRALKAVLAIPAIVDWYKKHPMEGVNV